MSIFGCLWACTNSETDKTGELQFEPFLLFPDHEQPCVIDPEQYQEDSVLWSYYCYR